MPKFKVEVSKDWTEYGDVEVEADDEDEARDAALGLLIDGSEDIQWQDSMDPGDHRVEGAESL